MKLKIGWTNGGNVVAVDGTGGKFVLVVKSGEVKPGAEFPDWVADREVEAETVDAALRGELRAATERKREERDRQVAEKIEAERQRRARFVECAKLLGRRGIAAARKLAAVSSWRGPTVAAIRAAARTVRGARTLTETAEALEVLRCGIITGRDARHRRRFGGRWIEPRKWLALPAGTPADRLRAKRADDRVKARAARVAAAAESKRRREADRAARELARKWGVKVPVPLRGLSRSELAEVWPRLGAGVEWSVEPWFENEIVADAAHESRKGRRGWYTVAAADHRARVKSFGVIGRGGAVLTVHQGEAGPRTLRAPEGCVWMRDEHGLKVAVAESRRDDYHPVATEFRRWDRDAVGAKLEANRAARLIHEAAARVNEAEAAGVWCCVADSIRAGNCRQGTEAWAAAHGMDAARHYPAMEVLRRANGDAGRVRIVVAAAIVQARKDTVRGFAILSEHGCQAAA